MRDFLFIKISFKGENVNISDGAPKLSGMLHVEIMNNAKSKMQSRYRTQSLDIGHGHRCHIATIDGGPEHALDGVHLHTDVHPVQECLTCHEAYVIRLFKGEGKKVVIFAATLLTISFVH